MKKLLIFLIVVFTLTGCGKDTAETTAPTETQTEGTTAPVYRIELSELEIQNMFLEYAESGWVIFDCVAVTESDYGIVGVVQYTTEDYDGCRFDFMRMDGPLQAGIGAPPAGEDRLVYAGGDSVTCELLKADGEIYTCTVSYYETESEVGFKVVG